ncbi:MAG: GC-type dockerin domain-anchored protein [Phycisphaerales bacterium]
MPTLNRSIASLTLASVCSLATGQDAIVVTTLNDVTDFAGARQVADLPGADGLVSFREAVTAANNTAGPDTIHFAISQDQWWLVSTYALLRLEDGVFVLTDDETTIDFSTQTDFTGDTNPDGMEVGIYGLEANGWGTPAIIIQASNCVIRGMGPVHQRGASVSVWSGNNNRFVGNVTGSIQLNPYPGTTSGNIIGGIEPGEANDLNSVQILCGANDNTVIGNRVDTVSVTGSRYCAAGNEYPLRNRIGGSEPGDRNVINDFGNYGHEGFPQGQGVRVHYARETLIEGNYIGVTADGMSRHIQRGTAGIRVADAVDTTIRDNLIAGIRVVGVNHYAGQVFGQAIDITALDEDNSNIVIENNLIGTDATGMNPITTRAGIVIQPLIFSRTISDVRIGSPDGSAGNTIAFTELDGIRIASQGQSIEITGNDIHSNGGLGIDLLPISGGGGAPGGVTPNDAGDLDQGANSLQNFPTIDTATTDGLTASISGTLSSLPGRDYRIEFFASPEADPSGHGEGQRFLGSTDVITDATGDAGFDATLPADMIGDGWVATSTATDLAMAETSEFGPALGFAIQAGCPADLNADGLLDFFDLSMFLNAFTSGDPAGDFDGNGMHDFFDISGFLNAFTAGCP